MRQMTLPWRPRRRLDWQDRRPLPSHLLFAPALATDDTPAPSAQALWAAALAPRAANDGAPKRRRRTSVLTFLEQALCPS